MSAPSYVMVTASYPPHAGGVERHVDALHRALGARGRRGRVVVLRARPGDADDAAMWIPFPAGLSRRRILAAPASVLRLLSTLRAEPGAVLHFHDASTLHPFLPLLAFSGLLPRAFVTFHGWEGKFPPDPVVVRQRRACERAVAGSIIVGEFIRTWYGTPGDVVTYGGAEVARFEGTPAASGLPLRAAYVGRLEPDTGVPAILGALRAGGVLPVTFFGGGSLAPALRAAGAAVEPVPADILDVYRSYPVIIASGYLTILEALCAGRVVLACHENDLRRDYLALHPAAASLLLCGGPGEVRAALGRCEADLPAALSAAAPGWAWARAQSWERVADAYERLWEEGGRRERG